MNRILKQYTIVPDSLYIERDADRQLKDILEDMQRPGYVLVARQMGKTNLLLNAKNKYEINEDIYTYIDLSNESDTEKECFETIIDTIIDTHEDIFHDAKEEIREKRLRTDRSPQKAHSDELRILLKYVEKLVIILDEIDALTKTSYSDSIFAQIRSTYFNRINFPELKKLTYILSGVVEPTEIIKNPKISPFNIGQKIFIGDFSNNEFLQFIKKSGLSTKLSNEVIERIYFWTNGNPRMTWDLCYEVESRFNSELTLNDIDDIVNESYLTSFDKPPVDNIRELIINDRELRDAVIQIHYKKEDSFSDKLKNKLYLTGIVNYNNNSVSIKNEIIKKSISLDWLRKVEEDDKGLIKIALEYHDKNDFKNSLDAFERYLENNDFNENEIGPYYYYMGYNAYRINKFEKSLEYLHKSNFTIEDEPSWYFRLNNLKGLVYFYNNETEKSLSSFKEVLNKSKKDELYVRALINYSSISMQNNKEYKEDVENVLHEIISGEAYNGEKLSTEFKNKILSIAYYNIAQIQMAESDSVNAKINYSKALDYAETDVTPTILISLLKITKEKGKRDQIAEQLIYFLDNQNNINNIDPDEPMNFNIDRFKDIVLFYYTDYRDTYFERIKEKLNYISDKGLGYALLELSTFAIKYADNFSLTDFILKDIYENFDNPEYQITDALKYDVLKSLAYSAGDIKYREEYIALLIIKRFTPIDHVDFEIFTFIISYYIRRQRYDKSLRYINIIESLKPEIEKKDLVNYLLIEHFKTVLHLYQEKRFEAILTAREIIRQLNIYDNDHIIDNSPLKNELLEIKKQANSVIQSFDRRNINRTPIINKNKYSRNDFVKVRYISSNIEIEKKYKFVEKDIQEGKCIIISNKI